jgi:hypothetical protein
VPSADAPDPHAQLTELLEQIGVDDGYVARVERRDSRGGSDYLGTVALDANLFDEVKNRWGGGKFRARVSDSNAKYVRSITFGIAGLPRDRDASTPQDQTPGLTRLEGVVAAMADGMKALTAQLALVAHPKSNVAEFAEIAKVIRDLTPPPAPASSPVDMFAQFNQMLELRDRIAHDVDSDGREPRDGLGMIVDKGIDKIVPLLSRKMDLDEKAAGVTREKTKRRAATTPAALPSDPVAAMATKIPNVARVWLADCAKKDKDPSLYADVVLDSLPDTVYAQLPDLLGNEDFAARLCAAVPQFAVYPAWFAKLADALRTALLEAAEEEAGEGDEQQREGAA